MDKAFKLTAKKLNEHNITWWLEGGSMIGAVREGKRIEWDEDYDIGFWMEDCRRVFMALRELKKDGLMVLGNLHLGVANKTGEHYICIMPHKIIKNHVYKITGFLGILQHVIRMPIPKMIIPITKSKVKVDNDPKENKLSLQLQLIVQWFQMKINYRIVCRGTVEEYASFLMKDMGEILAPVPIGYDSLLKNNYGDYITPNRDLNTCFNGTDLKGWHKQKREEMKKIWKEKGRK